MKRYILHLMMLLACPCIKAQNSTNYDSLWLEVYRLELKEQTRSASQIVDSIYASSKKEKRHLELTKALFYQSKFALVLEEDAEHKVYQNFIQEIENNDFPSKNLLQNTLATMLWQYYERNRWSIDDRTTTPEEELDFRKWDLKRFYREMNSLYTFSLADIDKLVNFPIDSIDYLIQGDIADRKYRPSLYDFLAHQAFPFYKERLGAFNMNNDVLLKNSDYFNGAKQFVELVLPPLDSAKGKMKALSLYQSLLLVHLNDKSPYALVDADLDRLSFMKSFGVMDGLEEKYEAALIQLADQYDNHIVSAQVKFDLAKFYLNQGDSYNTLYNDNHQFKRRKAVEICDEITLAFPQTPFANNAKLLKEEIQVKESELTVERFVPEQYDSKFLLRYRNLDSIGLSIYKVTQTQLDVLDSLDRKVGREEKEAFIKALNPLQTWNQKLVSEGDYQFHTTEVVLPALDKGIYVLTGDTDANKSRLEHLNAFHVTNLALIDLDNDTTNMYQVVDRRIGKPIPGVSIRVLGLSEKKVKLDRYLTSDSKGLVSFETDLFYPGSSVLATYKGDTLLHRAFSLYKTGEEEEEDIYAIAQLFTDRSIYHPGQTVYYKGIFLQHQGHKSKVVPDEQLILTLYDTNGDEVEERYVRTNEYGSFSGNFKLPQTTLTGTFTMEIDEGDEESEFFDHYLVEFDYPSFDIQVEEYKRPTFEVSFDEVEEVYQPNDSVALTGNAKALSGANLTGAKVKYSVTRSVNYASWRYYRNPNNTELASGEITTKGDGTFDIPFVAVPDLGAPEADNPVFEYRVNVDVTDINGETRSASKSVKVGYQSLDLSINFPVQVHSDNITPLVVSTMNLNGSFIPASGKVAIYKMQSPKAVYRDRPWPFPDYQIIPEDTFRKAFPYETFKETDTNTKSPSSLPALETEFDTGKTSEVDLSRLKTMPLGRYQMEVTAFDENGKEATQKQQFTLINQLKEAVAENERFSIMSGKRSHQVGDTAKIIVASAAEDVTVNLVIDQKGNHQIIPVRIQQGTSEVSIPIRHSDLGGFKVFFYYTLYNDYFSGTFNVDVAAPSKGLSIETSTFRDKLLPGAKETWAFTVKGPNTEKFEAEVLASMYDASLDQFQPHSWSLSKLYPRNYNNNYNPIGSLGSFGTRPSRATRWIRYGYNFGYSAYSYPELNWFGFSFIGDSYVKEAYNNLLKWRIQPPPIKSSVDDSIDSGLIEGIVRDENGDVLTQVEILVRGSTERTNTDEKGRYKIKSKNGEALIFRFLGYNTIVAEISAHNRINVHMQLAVTELSEVVVTALGITRDKAALGYAVTQVYGAEFADLQEESAVARILRGKVPGVQINHTSGLAGNSTSVIIRGYSSISGTNQPLFVIDGVPFMANSDRGFTSGGATASARFLDLDPNNIGDISVLKGLSATTLYGEAGRNGVILITTVEGQKKKDKELAKLKVRKDFREMAFFYPHLTTNKKGEVKFNFTAPETLTRWKLQLLAHTKSGQSGKLTKSAVTQKDLMVMPNLPRFFRAGDTIVVSTKVINLTSKPMVSSIAIYLEDPSSEENIEADLLQDAKLRTVTITPGGNSEVSWKLAIPEDLELLQYKIVAKAGNFSDGEQKVVPILSNRMLVTETLPLWTRGKKSKQFTLEKLKTNSSSTLKHHRLTLEMTSNPGWYAIQSLPYLIEYPYECSEQTFSRLYANALATEVINSQPKIKTVFEQWRANGALESKLEANQELKSLLLEETPWVRDAKSENEQRQRLALLFDMSRMSDEFQATAYKLQQMQLDSGGFPWFSGGRWASPTITQHIVKGFGHLKHLGISWGEGNLDDMVEEAIDFLQEEIKRDHRNQLNENKRNPDVNSERIINTFRLEYLYTRTFFGKSSFHLDSAAHVYFLEQGKRSWTNLDLYGKALMALIAHRNDEKPLAKTIIKALKENSITSDELGMYWKANKRGWRWYQSPIEVQALIIEAFSEIDGSEDTLNALKTWLLKQKQVNSWGTTKATSEAAYALLLQSSDWLAIDEAVDVEIGGTDLDELKDIGPEAGTGYFKTTWTAEEINQSMATVNIDPKSNDISWGGLYWQYFEDLDKITRAETPLKLEKQLFVKKHLSNGSEPMPITKEDQLEIGDLIRVRIVLTTDREMEFIHMKDMRAAGLEPINVISKHKYRDGLSYYESTRDAATNFFFEKLPKGVHVFEYDLRVNNAGDFSNGVTTIQSMYAPEFTSHSAGKRIKVIK